MLLHSGGGDPERGGNQKKDVFFKWENHVPLHLNTMMVDYFYDQFILNRYFWIILQQKRFQRVSKGTLISFKKCILISIALVPHGVTVTRIKIKKYEWNNASIRKSNPKQSFKNSFSTTSKWSIWPLHWYVCDNNTANDERFYYQKFSFIAKNHSCCCQ